ncbi:MAG: ATP synthase F1 subunit gamma [Candidatus Dormibacteria bacterium]
MANLRDIRRRIGSVKNTQKITNAMQLVAAAKLRRAQAQAESARPYAELSGKVLTELTLRASEYRHPYLVKTDNPRSVAIVITTDRGLCGALNSNAIRAFLAFEREQGDRPDVVVVGRKGRDVMKRLRRNVVAEVTNLGERPSFTDIVPAVSVALQEFEAGRVGQVHLVFSRFVSVVRQQATVQRLIPVEVPERTAAYADYIYEPAPEEVLDHLLPRYVEAQVYRALLENLASEQAAKMVAMQNATDAARDLISALTLLRNKLRQEQITNELMEIVGGAAALKAS